MQIYTGDGKGKTTASVGLAVRACGAGLRVAFIQFLKHEPSSEITGLSRFLPAIHTEFFGRKRRVGTPFTEEDREIAQRGLERAEGLVHGGDYDLVVLDEILVVLSKGLAEADRVLGLCGEKPEGVELVLTGRGAPQRLIEAADLVTEMRPVRHYFEHGVGARRGIER